MSTEITPTRRLSVSEAAHLRELVNDRGEKASAELLGVSTLTQTRALSGLTLEASTVARLRERLDALHAEGAVGR